MRLGIILFNNISWLLYSPVCCQYKGRRYKRFAMKYPNDMLQMDIVGPFYLSNSSERNYIISCLEDCSRKVASSYIEAPEPTFRSKQQMCLDKGYDFPEVYELLKEYGYTIHILLRGEEKSSRRKEMSGYRARHWVVERTHSWMNRFRRLLIRWDKKIENHIAMLHFACAWITYRRGGVLG
jgi:transposase